MSTVLGKRKPCTDTGSNYGMLSAGGAFPGAFPAMEPPDAKNDPPDANNDEDYDDEDGEDDSQMSMGDAQFEAELQLRMRKFWIDEMQLLRVRARMSACPAVQVAHCTLIATGSDRGHGLHPPRFADRAYSAYHEAGRMSEPAGQYSAPFPHPNDRLPPCPSHPLHSPTPLATRARADDRERCCADPCVWCVVRRIHMSHTHPVGPPNPWFLPRAYPATHACQMRWPLHSMRALHPLADGACMGVHRALESSYSAAARPAVRNHELAHV